MLKCPQGKKETLSRTLRSKTKIDLNREKNFSSHKIPPTQNL